MTAKRYFQCSFFLPLIWLIPTIPAWSKNTDTPTIIFVPIEILAIGIPYLIFLVAALIWTKKQSLNQVLFVVWFAPLTYGLILSLCLSIVTFSIEASFVIFFWG